MGFGIAAKGEELPSMALVGLLSGKRKSVKGASLLAKAGADGAVIEGVDSAEALKEIAKRLDTVPWGIRVSELSGEQVEHYREDGSDFLAFGPERALLGALEEEDVGYLLCIPPDMDDRSLRTIENLPVDAVLLSLKELEPPLTVQHLIAIGSVREMFGKYLLLEVPGDPAFRELEALRDIGVDGLVVDVDSFTADALGALKARLVALRKRQRSKAKKSVANLPSIAYTPLAEPSQEEWDDDP